VDLEAARAAMIDSQVRTNDVTDRRLIAALGAVSRELFVPDAKKSVAYADAAIETATGRYLWPARDLAKLLAAASVQPEDRVLDIAPGTGYSSAVLSHLAAQVSALEESEAGAGKLRETLMKAGATGVDVGHGSLKAGRPGRGPFDVILVNGAVEEVPDAWLEQLAEGGRLAVVIREGTVGKARIYTRTGGKTAWRTPFESTAPALPGFERAPAFRF
jgi:protein-L-isoaspartate(D-aspartate) O-methyltransferase